MYINIAGFQIKKTHCDAFFGFAFAFVFVISRFWNRLKKGKVEVINIHSPGLPTTRPSICLDVRKYQYPDLNSQQFIIRHFLP